jgi:hypothetical protein
MPISVQMDFSEDMFVVEIDPNDPKRVNVLVRPEYYRQLKMIADLVEANLELV